YTQEGAAGPFDAMETRLVVAAADEGARVTARSSVSLGLPLAPVTDRVAAWKRRGELRRLLDTLADGA
ncbi:MAG: SRPBCC family protein, partial [Haloplanus sp.]